MALSRYEVPDAFTLEELRRQYRVRGSKGRIRLLARLVVRKIRLHKEIRNLAIGDESSEVRVWAARHLYLSEEERDRLQNDADEFVRAALWENLSGIRRNHRVFEPELDWLDWFKAATPLERLAMMRNPEIADTFVEKVLDPEDTELGIDIENRRELVLALLSNEGAVQSYPLSFSEWRERVGDQHAWASDYLHLTKEDKEHHVRLWALAAKWPPQSGVPYSVYRHVSIDPETKLRVYKECGEPILRQAILENEAPELDQYGHEPIGPSKVLEIGKKDSDEECRKIAERRSPPEVHQETKFGIALSVGWHSAINVLTVALAFYILKSANTQFETVSFAMLILLFAVSSADRTNRNHLLWKHAVYETTRDKRLLELLKDPDLEERTTKRDRGREIARTHQDIRKAERKTLIYLLGWSVVAILAGYHILRVTQYLSPATK